MKICKLRNQTIAGKLNDFKPQQLIISVSLLKFVYICCFSELQAAQNNNKLTKFLSY